MIDEVVVQEGFSTVRIENDSTEVIKFTKEVDNTYIQLHFCVNEAGKLHYGPMYSIDVKENTSLLLYNPNQNLPIYLTLEPRTKYLVFIVSIEVFHSFFSQVSGLIHFLDDENKDKKYYVNKDLSPSESLVINQIIRHSNEGSLANLYIKGKVYELLSLYFNKEKENNDQACPFLDSEENVEKIKRAKQIVIENLAEPPSLQEIADEIGLSVSKLKEGFKHIYGESVFNFLLDYKMEYARKMLLTKQYNVSEISLKVGYSTASHFIAAFKKKYGTTPKQYIMSIT